MSRVHPFGWHANIQLDGRELPQWEGAIRSLPGKFVIDHVGKYLEPVTPEARRVQVTAAPARYRTLLGQAFRAL